MKRLIMVPVVAFLFAACEDAIEPNEGVQVARPALGLAKGTEKVTICHKGKTITVGAPAVPAHLAHGDAMGPCGPGPGCVAPPDGLVAWWPGDGNAEVCIPSAPPDFDCQGIAQRNFTALSPEPHRCDGDNVGVRSML